MEYHNQQFTEDHVPSMSLSLHEQLENYPWSTDSEFQSGLSAILGPSQSRTDPLRLEDLTLRARCFYFERKYNVSVDFDDYKAWRQSQSSSNLAPLAPVPSSISHNLSESLLLGNAQTDSIESTAQTESPPTFAEIMTLIQNEQPIPGIKNIPDTVLEGQGTQPTQARRQKPWEVAKEQNERQASRVPSVE